MIARAAVGALVATVAVFAHVSTADASPRAVYGVQDDAWLVHGPGTLESRLDVLDRMGVDVVRYTVRWYVIAGKRPQSRSAPAGASPSPATMRKSPAANTAAAMTIER